MYDPEPDRLITNELKRDFGGSSGDGFGVILDTFQDRRNAVRLSHQSGRRAARLARLRERPRNDANWHGVWSVKTHIRPDGWSLEFAIPFKTLRFPDGAAQEWGLNMVRWARRANETSTWAPVPRQFSHYNVAYAGTLDRHRRRAARAATCRSSRLRRRTSSRGRRDGRRGTARPMAASI